MAEEVASKDVEVQEVLVQQGEQDGGKQKHTYYDALLCWSTVGLRCIVLLVTLIAVLLMAYATQEVSIPLGILPHGQVMYFTGIASIWSGDTSQIETFWIVNVVFMVITIACIIGDSIILSRTTILLGTKLWCIVTYVVDWGLTGLLIYVAIMAWKQTHHGEKPADVHHQTVAFCAIFSEFCTKVALGLVMATLGCTIQALLSIVEVFGWFIRLVKTAAPSYPDPEKSVQAQPAKVKLYMSGIYSFSDEEDSYSNHSMASSEC